MSTDETSESSCDGCKNGTARESGREFAGPDEFRDDDVVIWFPNQVFKNRISKGRCLERDLALSLWFPSPGCNAGSGVRGAAELQMR